MREARDHLISYSPSQKMIRKLETGATLYLSFLSHLLVLTDDSFFHKSTRDRIQLQNGMVYSMGFVQWDTQSNGRNDHQMEEEMTIPCYEKIEWDNHLMSLLFHFIIVYSSCVLSIVSSISCPIWVTVWTAPVSFPLEGSFLIPITQRDNRILLKHSYSLRPILLHILFVKTN